MSYDKYDKRLESLVVETVTHWSPEINKISEQDKTWLATAIHAKPELASKVHYERMHTGFTREITVTVADLERLYEQKVTG